MSKMKGYLAMAMAMAAMAGSPPIHSTFKKSDVIRPHKFKVTPKGMREYTIDGITVMALNFKNAVRKVDKIRSSILNTE